MDCYRTIFNFVKKCPRRAEKLFSWTLFYSKVVRESIKIVFRGHFFALFYVYEKQEKSRIRFRFVQLLGIVATKKTLFSSNGLQMILFSYFCHRIGFGQSVIYC